MENFIEYKIKLDMSDKINANICFLNPSMTTKIQKVSYVHNFVLISYEK